MELFRNSVCPFQTRPYQPVIDLRSLNHFVPHVHFQMEGRHCFKPLLRNGDSMTSIDVKDSYFFRSITQILSKVSSFHLGHSSAPGIFTKLLKSVAAFLRKQGCRIIIYLDNVFLLTTSKEEALRLTQVYCSPWAFSQTGQNQHCSGLSQ